MTIACRAIAVAFVLGLAVPAGAQDAEHCRGIEERRGGDTLRMLDVLDQAQCLGEERDAESITQSVRPRLASAAADDPAQAGNLVDDALREVAQYVRDADDSPLLAVLAGEIETLRRKLLAQQPLGERSVRGWDWGERRLRGVPAVDVSGLDIKCPPASEPRCREAAQTGKAVFRAVSLVRQALEVSQRPVYEQALAATRIRDAKWTGYFDEARLQFPWELYVNGLRYGRANRKAGGFAEPPNDQLIVLHPGLGMEYVSGAPAGSRFEPALVVELVGYNRWSWTAEGRMRNAYGVSLIQSFSDRAGFSSWRPGVMLHLQNKYSIALTRDDGKTGALLSIDLAKLVTRVEDDARGRFRLLGRGAD